MYENIKYWLRDLRPNWPEMQRIRGVVRDRRGKLYWLYVWNYWTGHFRLSLYAWPCLSFSDWLMVGWVAVGFAEESPMVWTIHDVQVSRSDKRRGVGAALVRAAIALARRRGAQELCGFVTTKDAQEYPFLPAWYASLGFTIQFCDVTNYGIWGGALAFFRMDLSPAGSV